MTKEEFEQLKSTVKQWLFHTGSLDPTDYVNELKLKFIEPKEKRIAELTEWLNEASDGKLKLQMLRADLVLKIGNQEKRIAKLEEQQFTLRNERNTFLTQNEHYEKDLIDFNEKLIKAKEIIRKFLNAKSIEETCVAESEAEQFLSEVEE